MMIDEDEMISEISYIHSLLQFFFPQEALLQVTIRLTMSMESSWVRYAGLSSMLLHRRLSARKFLHEEAVAQSNFTRICFYTKQLLHTDMFLQYFFAHRACFSL